MAVRVTVRVCWFSVSETVGMSRRNQRERFCPAGTATPVSLPLMVKIAPVARAAAPVTTSSAPKAAAAGRDGWKPAERTATLGPVGKEVPMDQGLPAVVVATQRE